MDAVTIGGYPINITSLTSGQMIFFNGREWVAESLTTQSPTVYSLDTPTINNEVPFSLDGVPVIIQNLMPGDALTLSMYSGLVPVDSLATIIPYYQVIKNVPWSRLYCNMDDILRPTNTNDVNTDNNLDLVVNHPILEYTTSVN